MILTTLLITLLLGPAISYLLLIWFKKDTIIEYGRLIKPIGRWLHVDTFLDMAKDDPEFTYPKYIKQYRADNFFTRLITCEICLSLWLANFLTTVVFGFMVALTHNALWCLLSIPATFASAYVGLFLYFALVRMMSNGN